MVDGEKEEQEKQIDADAFEKKMESFLEQIEPTKEDFINNRIRHKSFAKIVLWLTHQSLKQDFVYSSELASFMKFTQTRAYQVLRDLCKAGFLMRKNQTSTLVEFHFVKNGHKPLITKYIEVAMRSLDLE